MPDLVPVPWQPWLFMTPHTLAYFEAVGRDLGSDVLFNSAKSPTGHYLACWRDYDDAVYLWDLYLHHGGSPASNPQTGQRSHLRGAAGDTVRQDAAFQAACRRVGLIRDPAEAWHWNDPSWASMPIIKTNTNTAGGGGIPIGEDDMNAEQANQLATVYGWVQGMVFGTWPTEQTGAKRSQLGLVAELHDALMAPRDDLAAGETKFALDDTLASQVPAILDRVNKLPLAPPSTGSTPVTLSLSDADVARIVAAVAPAVADVLQKRLES